MTGPTAGAIWPEYSLHSWQEFREICDGYGQQSPFGIEMLYRGIADQRWQLKPSLLRHLHPGTLADEALRVELAAKQEFYKEAQVYTRESDILWPRDSLPNIDWWIVMQHYSAPTRLLDWTSSPYVAAYFSVEKFDDLPGAICYFQPGYLVRELNTKHADWQARITGEQWDGETVTGPYDMSRYASPRMVAQQGHFTISTNVLADHGVEIAMALTGIEQQNMSEPFGRWIIPAALKATFRWQLRNLNVTASTLFPGVDGLGRSIVERVRLLSGF